MAVAPGQGVAAPSRPPPPTSKPPLIPLELFPAPEQRLTFVAVFVLIQAWKVADLLAPATSSLVGGGPVSNLAANALQDEVINSKLLKWIAIDLVTVSALATLRIPRLDFKWKGLLIIRVALCLLDYILFGHWTVSHREGKADSIACCQCE